MANVARCGCKRFTPFSRELSSYKNEFNIVKGNYVIPDVTSLPKASYLPSHVKDRLRQAYKCPYRIGVQGASSGVAGIESGVESKPVEFVGKLPSSRSTLLRTSALGSGMLKSKSRDSSLLRDNMEKKEKRNTFWIQDGDIRQMDDGRGFVPAAAFTRYLNLIFRPGGWSLVPCSELIIAALHPPGSYLLSRKYDLVSYGHVISTCFAYFTLNRSSSVYGVETLRSKAISTNAQKIGLGLRTSLTNNCQS